LRIAFKEVGLIHGDLSEYNVMYSMEEGKAYVIDWPQAKSVKERDYDVYLSKDIKKLVNFFN
jgi:RIO-like serine/threonine protein kinase fused to N-terminal HTH domain